jgi:hypothetical protein
MGTGQSPSTATGQSSTNLNSGSANNNPTAGTSQTSPNMGQGSTTSGGTGTGC